MAQHLGVEAENRLLRIAQASLSKDGVTRLPFTPQHREALEVISTWMERAGMNVSLDAAGTLVGRLKGSGPEPRAIFAMGSHQDSVRNGGRYDGIMGVVLATLVVEKLVSDGFRPLFDIEVYAFADEEGVRFPTALLGPRALAGTLDPAVVDLVDGDGIRLGDDLNAFGGEETALTALVRDPRTFIGYLEMHIEQGPVLERENLAFGIVSSICGIERHVITVSGKTGHTGTVPMDGRKDALVAAANIIQEVNRAARQSSSIRATVGTLTLTPAAVNQIPDRVIFSLEIRAPTDADRVAFRETVLAEAQRLVRDGGCEISTEKTYEQTAEACDPILSEALAMSAKALGHKPFFLPSGATHDASAMADLCPISMVFVQCRGGLSHTPEEYASPDHMNAAIELVARMISEM